MSVVGFDVGNDASCVALARKRGIDVLMNKESKRETPSCISFGEKMRFLGTDGAAKISMNPKNTVNQLKRLIGKKFKDPQVQTDISKLPFSVTEGPDGGLLVNVMYCNERQSFSPEQLMAMVLVDLKKIAESEGGAPVVDCCISVPAFYTEAERYAMLAAASTAGLNTLRLINETTATAIAYGIYKTDLPETDPVNVAFVDIGHASTQVSVVSFKRGGLQVKSHAWDRNFGGRDLDEAMFDHFCEEFKAKHKIDVKTNAKAAFKLRTQCEKLKKILSANPEAPLNIECLMEDQDVRSSMTRDKLEELVAPLFPRVQLAMERALADSGLTQADISSVEMVGSSTRVPILCKMIEDFFGRAPSRTMHSKECIARGACLQCAMLSPVFKVRDFEVVDIQPYAIAINYERDGEAITQQLFAKGDALPSSKMVSFARKEAFSVTAAYVQDDRIPDSFDRTIGTFNVGPFSVPAGQEKAKLKVRVRLNLHGLVGLEGVQAVEEVTEEVEVPQPAAKAAGDAEMKDAAAAEAAGDAAAGAAPMETEAAAAAPAKEKRTRTVKVDVPYAITAGGGDSRKRLDDLFEQEAHMQTSDRLQEETNERKNALEAYVYDLRNKLYDTLAPFVREADKESLLSALTAMEDWLYDEGEDCGKSVYVAKLDELKKTGDPIEMRYNEEHSRPAAVEQLRSTCTELLGIVTGGAPLFAHLSDAEKQQVAKECTDAMDWLQEKSAMQAQLQKYDEPVLVTADISKKRDMIERVCRPIVNKKPPPPPKPEPAPQPEAAPAAEPMDAEPAAGGEEAAKPMES